MPTKKKKNKSTYGKCLINIVLLSNEEDDIAFDLMLSILFFFWKFTEDKHENQKILGENEKNQVMQMSSGRR